MFFDLLDLYGIASLMHFPKLSENLSPEILMDFPLIPIWLLADSYIAFIIFIGC